MYDSFDNNLECLINETVSDALCIFKNKDEEYKKILTQYGESLNELEKLLDEDELSEKQKDIIKRYMDIEAKRECMEMPVIYFRGIYDLFKVLKKIGI